MVNRMNALLFTFIVWLFGVAGGLLGSMTGLGGGVVIIPVLTMFFGVDIRYAMGASLISVIATSSGSASVYVKEGYSNIRAAMFLEIATVTGAIIGAFLTAVLAPSFIAVIFGLVLIFSALTSGRSADEKDARKPDRLTSWLRMDGSYPSAIGKTAYRIHNAAGGFGLMFAAGSLSGLLGIGSGALKVLAMDKVMKMPFKVSTTTSNLMIGVTAAASAGVYIGKGYIEPGLVMPVMLGVLAGSLIGARILKETRPGVLRVVFAAAIFVLGLQMIYNGIAGRF